ncbi:MAG: hypothetical protein RMI04_08550 [Thermofilaceae archaeon]|nr:hypothetical protein [Thermofilaceae archaeon]
MLEMFVKRAADKVAKRARQALMQIPFYRRKMRDNKISINEVRGINFLARLDNFLNKYRNVQWITENEMIGMSDRYSSDLSLVPEKERVWVQASSGYTLSTRMLLDNAKKFANN